MVKTPLFRKSSVFGFTTITLAPRNFGNFLTASTAKSWSQRRNSGKRLSNFGEAILLVERKKDLLAGPRKSPGAALLPMGRLIFGFHA